MTNKNRFERRAHQHLQHPNVAAGYGEMAARLEALVNDLRWEQLLDDPMRAAAIDALAEQALVDLATGDTRPLGEILKTRHPRNR